MAPTVEVANLHRRYGGPEGFEAVQGVSFEVEEGQLFALLGTNGAGKTSTLEVMEGIAAPSAGTVRVMGMDPWNERRRLRPYLGIMLQSGGFPPELTVGETARMWAGTLSAPRPVDEALQLVDIDSRRNVAVKQLSGGEKRRLDLALALLNRPTVLFLDEPTTGLDPESRRNTWKLIRGVIDEGTTVVLTTHYLDEAESLADHLAIMHAGRIERAGTVTEIVADHPAHISFAAPHLALPALPAVTSTDIVRGVTTLQTTALQDTLTDLLGWARAQSIVLGDLNASTASLESVFLSFADRPHARDDAEPETTPVVAGATHA